jgi:aminoglycoside 2''-phosphotransferase
MDGESDPGARADDEPPWLRECEQVVKGCLGMRRFHDLRLHLTGWDNIAIEVDGSFYFRFARRRETYASLRKEVRLLPRLSRWLPTPVPRPRWSGTVPGRSRRPYLGYRKLPGVPLEDAPRRSVVPDRVRSALRRLSTELVRFPLAEAKRASVPGGGPASWVEGYARFYARLRRDVLPRLAARDRRPVQDLFAEFLSPTAPHRFRPVLCHRDLGPGHILWDVERGRVSGVLDWGDATIGDPAFDVLTFDRWGKGFQIACALDRRDPSDATFLERMEFYRRVIPLHTLLFATEARDPVLFREGVEDWRRSG